MLRATPNLHVFRPCDAVETAECWELALASRTTPSALVLSRQNLPTLQHIHGARHLGRWRVCRQRRRVGGRDVTLLATGLEVSLAMEAAKALRAEGTKCRGRIDAELRDLFEAQPTIPRHRCWRQRSGSRIEAGARLGWDRCDRGSAAPSSA